MDFIPIKMYINKIETIFSSFKNKRSTKMEQSVDQFYITLISSASMLEFPDNVLSSFTNKLAQPCSVNENWVVGISEIYYNSFTPSTQPSQKANLMLSDEVETFVSKKRKRKQREYVSRRKYQQLELQDGIKRKRELSPIPEPKVIIRAHKDYNIILTNQDLKDMCYEKNDMNFGKFLEVLPNKMYSVHPEGVEVSESLETARKKMKEEIMTYIKETDWSKVEKRKYEKKDQDYKLHVYMGSKVASLVTLHFTVWQKLSTFIFDIISQLPKDRRKLKDMIALFDIFYSKYKLNSAWDTTSTESILKIQFDEYGVSTKIDTKQLLQKKPDIVKDGISLTEIIKLFKNNLEFRDAANLSENDKIELRERIANSVLDVLRGNDLNNPYIEKKLKANDIPLNVLYNKIDDTYESYKTVLEPRTYYRMEEFLNEIYDQIPLKYRDKEVFVETLFDAFDKNADRKKKIIRSSNDKVNDQLKSDSVCTNSTATCPIPIEKKSNETPQSGQAPEVQFGMQPMIINVDRSPIAQPSPVQQTKQNVISSVTKHNVSSTRVASSFIYIYSDIIKPRFCSSQMVRAMRIIPHVETTAKRIEFKNIEYCTLERTSFDSVSMLLTDGQGKRIAFTPSQIPTYIQLHFKRA